MSCTKTKTEINTERLKSIGMLCKCGAVLSAVTYTCVLGNHCPLKKGNDE